MQVRALSFIRAAAPTSDAGCLLYSMNARLSLFQTFPRFTMITNKLRPVERLNGTGTVITKSGKEISVQYHLSFAHDSANGESEDAPPAGMKDLSGQVWCPHDGSFVCVHSGQTMTLCMEDGRKLRFSHRDRDGAISVIKWIG
jgi:hypothetical protein